MKSKVSIIIPAYNCEKYIKQCLDSVVRQTYPFIECLVVNDGSSDNTGAIINEYASKYKFIKNIYKKNGGPSSARNLGKRYATGDYTFFLDSDDWIDSICIEKVVKEAEKNKSDIVFFGYYKDYLTKSVPQYLQKKTTVYNNVNSSIRPDIFVYDMRNITVWGKLYATKCIKDIFFDERMEIAEDVDFNFRTFQNINSVVYMKDCLLHYRVHNGSAVHGFDQEIEEKFRYPIGKLKYMASINDTQKQAYYSFLGIAYILICKNMIYNNYFLNSNEKVEQIKSLRNEDWIQDLFRKKVKLVMPLSRKIMIFLGKYNMNRLMLLAYSIRDRMEN